MMLYYFAIAFLLIGFLAISLHLAKMEDINPGLGVGFQGLSEEAIMQKIKEPIVYVTDKKEFDSETSSKKKEEKKGKKGKYEGKFEKRCRVIFEDLFNVKFISVNPKWLINKITGHALELDGYNEPLNLAFEYDGEQHLKRVDRFQKNDKQFQYQVLKDTMKTKMCREKGVDLIRIPPYITYDDLESYIIDELTRINRWPRLPE